MSLLDIWINKMTKTKVDLSSISNFNSTTTLTKNDQNQLSTQVSVESNLDQPYNPYDHRTLAHPNTFTGALIHILKGSLGSGLLAVPRAFMSAGLLVGVIGTMVVGFICTYAIHLLVTASKRVSTDLKIGSLGFAETAEAVFQHGPDQFKKFSQVARLFVEISLTMTHFVGNAVYVVFISESIAKLVGFYHPPALHWGQYFKLIILFFLILFCQIRELKHLVPFSFIANVTMTLALAITGYYMIKELMHVEIKERKLATDIYGIPTFYTTVLFAMEGIGTIMPVENSMIEDRFTGCPGVLNTAMTSVVVFYTVIGFCGYFAYGDKTEATITLNLPGDEILAQTAQASISAAIFFTFMLQYYVPIDITWRRIKPYVSKEKENLVQIVWRTLTVTFIVGVAAAAGDNLGPLIDLMGAVFFSTLGLFVPSLLDIIVNWKNWGRYNWILVRDLFIITMFVFGFVFGAYYAVLHFIQ
uniref:Proton-coupled amino acid transporter-like protein pathetic isoform X1 n=2 Tax=Diabrotica virgifera virgifera TaxID=50390 RepID=A0A6P7FCW6_DIAVI